MGVSYASTYYTLNGWLRNFLSFFFSLCLGGRGGGADVCSVIVGSFHCLVVHVQIEVALQRPHVLVDVARRGDHLEAEVPEGVEHDDTRAVHPDAVLRVPALLVLDVVLELLLRRT